MLAQLQTVFRRMTGSLVLELTLDGTPLSRELEAYMQALCQLTDQLTFTTTGQDPEPPASGCAAPMALDGLGLPRRAGGP